jgi:glycosyltransferase involved in cell wall biosynthesis
MIYFIINNSPFYQGGVEQVVAQIVKNLPASYKKKVNIVANDKYESKHKAFNGVKIINLGGKKRINSRWGEKLLRLDRFFYAYRVYRYLKSEIKDGDIVNVHGLEYSFFLRNFRSKIKKKFKLIVTVHGSYFDTYSSYVSRLLPGRFFLVKFFFFFFRWYYFFNEKVGLNNVDCYIYISRYLQRYYKKTYRLAKKSMVILNGLNSHSKVVVKKRKDGVLRLLLVGSSYYGKGLDIALEIMKILHRQKAKVKLNIVGFDNCKKEDFRNSPNVNFIGEVPNKKMDIYYRESDILLLPSRNEGLPLVVLEAIKNGLPFVVSKNSHADEIKYWPKYGIVVSGYKVSEWVDSINKINSKYSFYARNVQKFDFHNYSWKIVVNKYVKCFQELK